jgi:hypothetical protein
VKARNFIISICIAFVSGCMDTSSHSDTLEELAEFSAGRINEVQQLNYASYHKKVPWDRFKEDLGPSNSNAYRLSVEPKDRIGKCGETVPLEISEYIWAGLQFSYSYQDTSDWWLATTYDADVCAWKLNKPLSNGQSYEVVGVLIHQE